MTQLELLRLAVSSLERLGIAYMVVGSIASMSYGEPRLTRDIDIVIDLSESQVDDFCAVFADPDFYLSKPAILAAIRARHMFNVIHTTSGNKLDFVLSRRDPWGKTQMERRQKVLVLSDLEAFVATPEDVVLGKLWYHQLGASDRHLRDIAGVLRVMGNKLDAAYVDRWANQLGFSETWAMVKTQAAEGEN